MPKCEFSAQSFRAITLNCRINIHFAPVFDRRFAKFIPHLHNFIVSALCFRLSRLWPNDVFIISASVVRLEAIRNERRKIIFGTVETIQSILWDRLESAKRERKSEATKREILMIHSLKTTRNGQSSRVNSICTQSVLLKHIETQREICL